MNQTRVILLLICLPAGTGLADVAEPRGPRIRQIVAENYPNGNVLVGATTGSWSFGQNQAVLMDREFSYVTPENDFKQSVVHPTLTEWNWARADVWVQHIRDNGQVLRIHGPISPQCSSWAKDDARTAAELEQNMREFFTALCQRYNGVPGFKYMDVVNEVVINGGWHKDRPGDSSWECPWYKIGLDNSRSRIPLYISYAFEIAAEHATDFRLLLNHHESPTRTASWELIKMTILELMGRGLPVHGIGWQAHVDVGWDTEANLSALSELITWAHNRGLDFHVTEQSVWTDDTSPELLEAQAQTYRNIVEVLLQHRNAGLVTWNTWHISDAHGWKKEQCPSLFDARYLPKPAYYALQDLLAGHSDPRCDFNLDNRLNWPDLQYLASWWLQDELIGEPADLNGSRRVDAADYAVFSQYWATTPTR